jgi:putative oxidoreductase
MTTPFSDVGLLLIRVVFGSLLSAHGAQKLLGWFGGRGLTVTGEFFVKLGFRPGRSYATLASATETVGGACVVLGFLGPIAPAFILAVMLVAIVTVHWRNGVFASKNGVELPLLFATAVCGLALTGFGNLSLDHALGLEQFWTPGRNLLALAIGLLGGIVNVLARRRDASA